MRVFVNFQILISPFFRYMEDHYEARDHFKKILTESPSPHSCVVSLGDLGESKSVDETKQLFAGTSACFKLTAEYLEGYGVPYEVIGGIIDFSVLLYLSHILLSLLLND